MIIQSIVEGAKAGLEKEKEEWKEEQVTFEQLRKSGKYSKDILKLFLMYDETCNMLQAKNGAVLFRLRRKV